MIIILGGDSKLGKSFANYLDKNSISYNKTTRKVRTIKNSINFNLTSDNYSLFEKIDYKSVIIFAAVTKLKQCYENRNETYKINVEGTSHVAEWFLRQERQVIFLSSNQVFDGLKPCRKTYDHVDPKSVYGSQKAEAEYRILKSGGTVLRLSKVLTNEDPLLNGWISDLKGGQKIRPFGNMWFAPVFAENVCKIIRRMIETNTKGIWHYSATSDISYFDAAVHLAQKMGKNETLIEPVHAESKPGVFIEHIPRNTTLDSTKTENKFNIIAPNPFDTLDYLL